MATVAPSERICRDRATRWAAAGEKPLEVAADVLEIRKQANPEALAMIWRAASVAS
jgi:hypothetical protein